MGYMVQIDENADASGNYTLLALSDAIASGENDTGPLFGLVPVGTFGALDDKNKLPVSDIKLLLFPKCMIFHSVSSTWSYLVIFIGSTAGHPFPCHRVDFVANCVSVSLI